ncbi:aspartate--ammonia ligase [Clostridium sp. Sa3CUN1]|uniref:Aspartate--ammonia ligase n=1 Tax=Clostridium gallinarum TaxID=2762246 RepID=A0ABR8Q3M8_9CLOT|nr:aspartate--ammonia ligase [Clostridium gallinarum]MBD7915031.1 aspartate--ammonia ligase [Clostridium gallinarum]
MNIEGIIIPKDYKSNTTLIETEINIKKIKDFFEKALAERLNLIRVSAPLFVDSESGVNDNLNGIERPVKFDILGTGKYVEIVHSLAKWKRLSLYRYGFNVGEGLYTDMNAIRRDEELDNIHSVYVDQWDWEKIITKEERNEEKLKEIVKDIYEVFKETEKYVNQELIEGEDKLPENIFFITTQELEDMYPNYTAKEREDAICKAHKAVFIMKIGDKLKSGEKHDGRSPDYDDWSLNGDILFWYPLLDRAVELSSMGIRVDKEALDYQLRVSGNDDKRKFEFHKLLLNDELPFTVGGGIGQSRICMFLLNKAHIGEVQASVWDEKNINICRENEIKLL